MIRFKCIYCGQRILAPDDGAGKKGHCPKCRHDLMVPKSTKGRPAISSDKEPMPDRSVPRLFAWEKADLDCQEDFTTLLKESYGFLVPTYDELSWFLTAVILILLYLANSQMRNQINNFVTTHAGDNSWPLLITFVLGFLGIMGLCIYHMFTTREKTLFEKRVMVGFAVLTNMVTGTIAAVYTLTNASAANWLLVFPVWNIINGLLLLPIVPIIVLEEECISDQKTTLVQIILALIAVGAIFMLCNYVFKLYWAITFSICIIYTTSFDRALQSVFPGIAHREDYICEDEVKSDKV